MIHNVLFDQLSTKTYNAQDAVQWTKDIADTIKERIKGDRKFWNFINRRKRKLDICFLFSFL